MGLAGPSCERFVSAVVNPITTDPGRVSRRHWGSGPGRAAALVRVRTACTRLYVQEESRHWPGRASALVRKSQGHWTESDLPQEESPGDTEGLTLTENTPRKSRDTGSGAQEESRHWAACKTSQPVSRKSPLGTLDAGIQEESRHWIRHKYTMLKPRKSPAMDTGRQAMVALRKSPLGH